MAAPVDLERLKIAMQAADIDQTDLAKAVGCTPSAINQIISGQTRQSRFIPDIADALGVSVGWLRGGDDREGPGFKTPVAVVPGSAEDFAHQLDLVGVEEISLEFGMGSTFLADHVDAVTRYMPREWLEHFSSSPASLLKFARGRGDSMYPTINSGDLVLIDLNQNRLTAQDEIWAIGWGDLGGLKRLRSIGNGQIKIMSDNKTVPDDIVPAEELRIIGRVCGNLRKI